MTSVGLVKDWLLVRIQMAREEVRGFFIRTTAFLCSGQLTASCRDETAGKLMQVEELSDPDHSCLFNATQCGGLSVHFMYNAISGPSFAPTSTLSFAYYYWCGRCSGDQDTECPLCVQAHGVIQEICRNDERLADQHNRFLGDAKENRFRAVAAVFGRPRIGDIATRCRPPRYGSLFPLTLYLYPLKLGRHSLCHLFQAY